MEHELEGKPELSSGDLVQAETGVCSTEGKVADELADYGTDEAALKLSKKQRRRFQKQQKWLLHKDEKRKHEREKKKARRLAKIERGEELGPGRKLLKRNTMADSPCDIKVAIDCSFDEFMDDRSIAKLVQQIQYSYSANRRAENPLQMYVTGLTDKTKERLDSIGDYKGWDVHFQEADYSDVFDKSKAIYLSSESDNILKTLDSEHIYIIGGLVDHNSQKGLCHRLAEEKGIAHAQLPIATYLELQTRKVLAVNHVFEILLRFSESQDWEGAFFSAIPKRKGLASKNYGKTSIPPEEQQNNTDSNPDASSAKVRTETTEDDRDHADCSGEECRSSTGKNGDVTEHSESSDSRNTETS